MTTIVACLKKCVGLPHINTYICLLLGDKLFESVIMLIETYSSDRGSLIDKKDGRLFNLLANVYSS